MKENSLNVAEAKRRFSELIGRVVYGNERVVISRRGKPVAVLVQHEKPSKGLASSRGWLDDNDPFFREIERIIKNRRNKLPRPVSKFKE